MWYSVVNNSNTWVANLTAYLSAWNCKCVTCNLIFICTGCHFFSTNINLLWTAITVYKNNTACSSFIIEYRARCRKILRLSYHRIFKLVYCFNLSICPTCVCFCFTKSCAWISFIWTWRTCKEHTTGFVSSTNYSPCLLNNLCTYATWCDTFCMSPCIMRFIPKHSLACCRSSSIIISKVWSWCTGCITWCNFVIWNIVSCYTHIRCISRNSSCSIAAVIWTCRTVKNFTVIVNWLALALTISCCFT